MTRSTTIATNDTTSSTITTSSRTAPTAGGGLISVGDADLWVERRGEGSELLLIAGLGDPAEVWSAQLDGLSDRYRMTAFDNRGVGRSPMPPDGFTVAEMADDAAALLGALDVPRAHVCGFSGGSATAQELALRHPELVDSLVLVSTWARPDAYLHTMFDILGGLPDSAPTERGVLETFCSWIYTPRAHERGLVDALIDEVMAFPHPQSAGAFQRQLAAWRAHDTLDRLHAIAVPTLVVAGALDRITPPRLGGQVAERIPGAEFVVLSGEAHQPFQESPDEFHDLVTAFWGRVERGS